MLRGRGLWLAAWLSCLPGVLLARQVRTSGQWNLLLVSIDTLRADHLGVYGYAKNVTPRLDQLASEGILFERAYTPVPLTLPAHAALLTAEYPATNGVRDNGEKLPSTVPTLGEQLHSHGFGTGAFVGAFVLDRRFGLARGFDEYWGDFRLYRHGGSDPGSIQIRGDAVEAAAAGWIAQHSSHRFFAFVHFYDLHGPYLMPASWRSRFPRDPYDGELAYVDDLIGRLWDAVTKRGLDKRTLLVVTADHGEGLGDHGEFNHGFFLYQETIHVPLIFRLPDKGGAGRRVPDVVRLIDIAPTVCPLLDIPTPESFQGRSLGAEIVGEKTSPLPAYAETLYPFRHFHCAPLFAVTSQDFSYIEAVRPELYDLEKDPRELQNLNSHLSSVANSLHQELGKLMGGSSREARPSLSPETLEALRSLGYTSIASTEALPATTAGLPDPKDRIGVYRRFQRALEFEERGQVRTAAEELEAIAATDPKLTGVQIEAGLARQRLHEDQLALPSFRAALAADPANALAHFDLGVSLTNLRDYGGAEKELQAAITLEPWFSRAWTALGSVLAWRGDASGALHAYGAALEIDPGDFDARLNRGKALMLARRWAEARPDLERAAALEPESASAHEALGTWSFYQSDLERAELEYKHAVRLDPSSSQIHADLGLLYRKLGRKEAARSEFKQALRLDASNADARGGLRELDGVN